MKSKSELDIDQLLKIINDAYSSYVDYDYDRSNCDGKCDGYCRCTVITNSKIKSVDVDAIVNDICHTDNLILKYCANRVLNHSEIRNPDYWELNVSSGYYGEEVNGARFTGHVPLDCLKNLLSFKNNNVEMIGTALVQEYGYLLAEISNVNDYHIVDVPLNSISIGQDLHYRRLDRSIVKRYKDFNLPHAVCLPIGNGKFRLIDGYHRIAAAKMNNRDNVEIILGIIK
jgi:hypothetical protein